MSGKFVRSTVKFQVSLKLEPESGRGDVDSPVERLYSGLFKAAAVLSTAFFAAFFASPVAFCASPLSSCAAPLAFILSGSTALSMPCFAFPIASLATPAALSELPLMVYAR
jgi:hypothetical protein